MLGYKALGYGKTLDFDEIKQPLDVKKELSVVIPTYNEEGNIKSLVSEIKNVLNTTKYKEGYEIVVVDDNSKDKTPQIIDSLAKQGNFVAIHRYSKRGIFSAVQDGVVASHGNLVLTMDADFSHPPKLIPQLLKHIGSYDLIIGSRYIRGGDMKASLFRKWGSKILNRVAALIIGVKVRDLGGNFRLFERKKFIDLNLRYEAKFAEFGL